MARAENTGTAGSDVPDAQAEESSVAPATVPVEPRLGFALATPPAGAAAIYVRASTEHQQYSTTNQTLALTTYAQKHGLHIVRVFEDDGRSGLDLRRRPALLELLGVALAPSRPFDVLLIYDVSRWGRFQDTDESAHYEFLCRRAGVKIVYCAEAFRDDGTSVSALLKSIKRVMAAEYSRDLSRKVLAGQCRLTTMGRLMGKVPTYGLRRMLVDKDGHPKGILEKGERKSMMTDRSVLAPGPAEEIAVVNRIFRMFVEDDLGETQIARVLTREGYASPGGALRWLACTVLNMLQNEKYIGNIIYNRCNQQLGRVPQMNPAESWIRVDGVMAPIVDPMLFKAAQAKIAARHRWSLSNDEMLQRLRGLYEREGRLTRPLVARDPWLPSPICYVERFGSFTRACELVGCGRNVAPYVRQTSFPKLYDEEMLINQLRALLDRTGRLSGLLIDKEPGMAGSHTFRRYFGSLDAAFAKVGYSRSQAAAQTPLPWIAPGRPSTRAK